MPGQGFEPSRAKAQGIVRIISRRGGLWGSETTTIFNLPLYPAIGSKIANVHLK
jgi:hypothetical protein